MWKASFTSVLAIKKKPPLRDFDITRLEGLLDAGVTLCVADATSNKLNFQEAASGPFKTAWNIMKNNNRSFVRKRQTAIQTMLVDDHFSYFDSLTSVSGLEAYKTCQISAIPAR